MGLKFYPRAGHTVPFAHGNSFGQLARYAGRSFKASEKPGFAGAFVADADPVEVEAGSADAEHFLREVQRGGMWPADEATAAACGVEFVKLDRDADGEWIAAKVAPALAPAPALVVAKKSEPKAAEG